MFSPLSDLPSLNHSRVMRIVSERTEPMVETLVNGSPKLTCVGVVGSLSVTRDAASEPVAALTPVNC
ncbi:hypothetical protein D9758_006478 [Tetrapyrgos nigripes]|uniref:Uncharacterized protein n=1 Tax=Tetrapyrgos nigripes TaxID=182062 RepID=A0A8H5GKR2_9AGAR|nr:hypothetical protein D9758_006478 [Tetrapyrgos nigripes]